MDFARQYQRAQNVSEKKTKILYDIILPSVLQCARVRSKTSLHLNRYPASRIMLINNNIASTSADDIERVPNRIRVRNVRRFQWELITQ